MLRVARRSQSFGGLIPHKPFPVYQQFCTEATEPKYSISPELALPKFVAGRWRQPKLSGRQIGVIKKKFRG